MRPHPTRHAAAALAAALLALAAPAAAPAQSPAPDAGEAQPATDPAAPPAPDPDLDADAIYERVLANRFESSVQRLELRSGDRAGREVSVEVRMLWRRYPEGSPEHAGGVLSRTLVRYLEPYDVRGAGYLIINKRENPDDQFVYLRSMRRIRRVNLRGETVVGTDLAVEDIVPREMDEATYTRGEDAVVQGRPCYVVDAVPVETSESRYSRFQLFVETRHFVPLRTRYWDAAGVAVKELRASAESIRELEGVWLPVEATMRHLLDRTWTTLRMVSLAPDPPLPERIFSQRQLQSRRLHVPDAVEALTHHFDAAHATDGADG